MRKTKLSRKEKKTIKRVVKKWTTDHYKLAKTVSRQTVITGVVVGGLDLLLTGGVINAGAYIGAWVGQAGPEIYHHYKQTSYQNQLQQVYSCSPRIHEALNNMSSTLSDTFKKHRNFQLTARDGFKLQHKLNEINKDLAVLKPVIQVQDQKDYSELELFISTSRKADRSNEFITHKNVFNKLSERRAEYKREEKLNAHKNVRATPKKLGK